VEVGFNYRMSNVLAGIGRGQLRVLDQRVQRRREVHEIYRHAFAGLPDLQWMPEPQGMRSTRWLTCLVLQGEGGAQRRDHVQRSLERHSIEARPVWKPMHLQPLFQGAPYFAHDDGDDVAARLFTAGVCLPSGSNLSDEQLARVVDHLRRALQRAEVLGAAAV
jgi:dTDP-4-amino-4,6-dideoxygalactose transaminase